MEKGKGRKSNLVEASTRRSSAGNGRRSMRGMYELEGLRRIAVKFLKMAKEDETIAIKDMTEHLTGEFIDILADDCVGSLNEPKIKEIKDIATRIRKLGKMKPIPEKPFNIRRAKRAARMRFSGIWEEPVKEAKKPRKGTGRAKRKFRDSFDTQTYKGGSEGRGVVGQ